MKEDIKIIQEKLIKNLKKLDETENDVVEEVSRSNAVSQLANTYIKSCNLIIRLEESKQQIKDKIKIEYEK